MDKISIRDLEFLGYHGVLEEEKKLGQKFLISLELKTDLRMAGITDDLDKTTHYGYVAKTVEDIFFSKKYDLIEGLAEDIARAILLEYSYINEVKVEIKKPWAPIGLIFNNISIEIKRKWNTVYLSLGSNMGDKKANIEAAIHRISELSDTYVTKKSTLIETEPFGYKEQDNFINSCIELRTLLYPKELLYKLLAIEKSMGRERKVKWGPRIIDLDIIFYNKEIIDDDDLVVPHPYIEYRDFVLKPLEEINPNFIHPILNKRIITLRKDLEENENKNQR